jgi:molecular chaperone DnaK
VATALISRNTPVPVKKGEIFTTAADMQTSVTVHVFQGERPMSRDNTSLGEFNLDGLAPAPRGVPKIEVTFDIDASGILDVTAKDVATGRAQSIHITGSTRLPQADKERMIKDAEKYAEEDRKRREQADKLNNADAICYQGERFLADFGEKVAAEQRTRIDSQIKDVKAAIAKKDADGATAQAEILKKTLQEAGTAIYQQAGAAQAGAEQAATGQSGAEEARTGAQAPHARVVDAQYRETKPSQS